MRFQQAMWLLLSLVLLASCFGVLGRGAYARKIEHTPLLTVEYDRVLRSRTQTDIVLNIDPDATNSGAVRVIVTGALFKETRLFDVMPKPASEELLKDGAVLTFKTAPGQPGKLTLIQKVEGLGSVQSQIAMDTGAPIRLSQFILP